MLLAVDIGNTSINNGIFEGAGGRPRQTFRIPAYARDLKQQYARRLLPYLNKIECAMIVSVAPRALRQVKGALRGILPGKILVVGRDVDSGVKNRYKDPGQVGQDRLVNARAAHELYGRPCIVVDFGTAITIDVVNRNKEYLGGVIAPGVEISLDALSRRAALLPKVNVKRPVRILGKETRQSMISGAVYGFSSLCDGIVKKLKKRYCRQAKVVATGGLSRLIGPYCESVNCIDPELTLKGLNLIFSEQDQEGQNA